MFNPVNLNLKKNSNKVKLTHLENEEINRKL